MDAEKDKILEYVHEQVEIIELVTADTQWDLEPIISTLLQFAEEIRKVLQLWEKNTSMTDSDEWLPFIEVATFITTLEVTMALAREGINRGHSEIARDMVFHAKEAMRSIIAVIEEFYAEK